MDKYTKFILTVIAVALLGILFKGELNNPAHAWNSNNVYMLLEDKVVPMLAHLINMH